ncbi:MAG: hypothetical protein GY703_17120, partial [Gammaproteobacteria bacterium]|nr:hypothetical protein [Gammaproteobacteria bacterium]
WEDYRSFASDYYNALYDFNQLPPLAKTAQGNVNSETKEEAKQRLIFKPYAMGICWPKVQIARWFMGKGQG